MVPRGKNYSVSEAAAQAWENQKRFNVDWAALRTAEVYELSGVPVAFGDVYAPVNEGDENDSAKQDHALLVFVGGAGRWELCRALKYVQFAAELSTRARITFLFDGARCSAHDANVFARELHQFARFDGIQFCIDVHGLVFNEFKLRTSHFDLRQRAPALFRRSSTKSGEILLPPELPVFLLRFTAAWQTVRPVLQYCYAPKDDSSDSSDLIVRLHKELGLDESQAAFSKDSFFLQEYVRLKDTLASASATAAHSSDNFGAAACASSNAKFLRASRSLAGRSSRLGSMSQQKSAPFPLMKISRVSSGIQPDDVFVNNNSNNNNSTSSNRSPNNLNNSSSHEGFSFGSMSFRKHAEQQNQNTAASRARSGTDRTRFPRPSARTWGVLAQ